MIEMMCACARAYHPKVFVISNFRGFASFHKLSFKILFNASFFCIVSVQTLDRDTVVFYAERLNI